MHQQENAMDDTSLEVALCWQSVDHRRVAQQYVVADGKHVHGPREHPEQSVQSAARVRTITGTGCTWRRCNMDESCWEGWTSMVALGASAWLEGGGGHAQRYLVALAKCA